MKDYFSWSLRQLYLLFFWRTQVVNEVKKGKYGHLNYVLKTLPWLIALTALGNLIAGYAYREISGTFDWTYSLSGMVVGITMVSLLAIVFRQSSALVLCVAFGIVLGAIFGGVVGPARGIICGLVLGGVTGLLIGRFTRMPFEEDAHSDFVFGVMTSITTALFLGLVAGIFHTVLVTRMYDVVMGLEEGLLAAITFSTAFWLTYFRLVPYPLEAMCSLTAHIAGKRWPHVVARIWQTCPIARNESIWLPLPFSSKLLALIIGHNRNEGFILLSAVATQTKLQRQAAVVALAEAALNDLQSASLLVPDEGTDRIDWFNTVPAEVPPDVRMALPHFKEAKQYIGQYLILHSTYRKSKALTNAITAMEVLQQSLITTRGVFTSRLRRVANDWSRTLLSEQEKLNAQVEAAKETPNPFVFGLPVAETEHNVFTGRRDVVRQIEASILGAIQMPTLLLYGPRRMGKTSILNQLRRLLGPEFAPAVIDCQNPAVTESEVSLFRYLSHTLYEGLLYRGVTVFPLSPSALYDSPFTTFNEWLNLVERRLPDNVHAVLCLDEYEHLKITLDAKWGIKVLDLLRHMAQHHPRIALMFTGAHTFEELGAIWTDRFISARRVRVGLLNRDEMIPLLTKPIPAFDIAYTPEAIEGIVAATNGQPFLTQAVAFELVQFLNEQQRKQARLDDVEEAIDRALGSAGEYFANIWNDAEEQGRAILRDIAWGDNPQDIPSVRKWLIEHDVLNDEGGFAIKLIERWVREKTK